MSLIEMKGVNKVYGHAKTAQTHALKDINLKIEHGEFCAVIGPSGSGKSTLLHIIGCLDTATSGEYALNGAKVDEMSEKERALVRNQSVGFILQSFGLIEDRTAEENVITPMLFSKAIPYREMRKRAIRSLERTGIAHYARKLVTQLSGGERQRVAIARAITMDHDLLLADEPTGQLDTQTADGIMEMLMQLNDEGLTCVIVTHDAKISSYCRRRIQLIDGMIITPDN